MIRRRFYYTIAELYDEDAQEGFNRLFIKWLGTYSDDTDSKTLWNTVAEELLYNCVCYVDIYHMYCDEVMDKPKVSDILTDPDLADIKDQITNQLRKIRSWLNNSKFRYSKLINLYNSNANNLMNQLASTTQFNDTPQTTNTGLDDDAYATTYTVNKTDAGTVLQRLSEVRTLWNSVINEWVQEFAGKFVYYI